MSLKTPIAYSCDIKCPACNHKYLYDFKISDINKVRTKEKDNGSEVKYNFDTYLICKNPLCNYDIELKGDVIEYPENVLNSLEINFIK